MPTMSSAAKRLPTFEVRFPGDRLAVPDLAGWRADLNPELRDGNPLRVIPTWCGEVLSPSTASDDRTLKLPMYASTGVAHVVRLPPFEVELSLATWWKAPAG
jgi:hypothetical protein